MRGVRHHRHPLGVWGLLRDAAPPSGSPAALLRSKILLACWVWARCSLQVTWCLSPRLSCCLFMLISGQGAPRRTSSAYHDKRPSSSTPLGISTLRPPTSHLALATCYLPPWSSRTPPTSTSARPNRLPRLSPCLSWRLSMLISDQAASE